MNVSVKNYVLNEEDRMKRKSSLLVFIGGLLAISGVCLDFVTVILFHDEVNSLMKIIHHPIISFVIPLALCLLGGFLMYRGIIIAKEHEDNQEK